MSWRDEDYHNWIKQLKNIAGIYYVEHTNKDIDNFKKLNIDFKKSYVVMHRDPEVLRKFMCIYIILSHINFERTFNFFDVRSYIDYIRNNELYIRKNETLVIHYNKGSSSYFGNTNLYSIEKLTCEVERRNMVKEPTILLLEVKPVAKNPDDNTEVRLLEKIQDYVEVIELKRDLTLYESEKDKGRQEDSQDNKKVSLGVDNVQ